ncbi:MAG: alpha/beta hydrolase [Desulfarculaceae bacterium]
MKPARRNLTALLIILLALFLAAPAAAEFADYQGNKVYYQVSGKGNPAVVFIHGWSCDQSFWRLNAPEVAKKYEVILLDLPGFGKSDKPKVSYTQDFLAGGVEAVIKKAGVKRPVLVGHSMGTTVARQVIRRHPEMVSALVIVDGAVTTIPKDPKVKAAREKRHQQQIADLKKDFAKAARGFIESLLGPAITPALRDEILSKMLAADRHAAISSLDGFSDPKVWQEDSHNLPTLAIYAKSSYITPGFESLLRRLFPNLKYQLWEGVGHFYMMERPGRFNAEVLNFLKSLPKSKE